VKHQKYVVVSLAYFQSEIFNPFLHIPSQKTLERDRERATNLYAKIWQNYFFFLQSTKYKKHYNKQYWFNKQLTIAPLNPNSSSNKKKLALIGRYAKCRYTEDEKEFLAF